MDPGALAKRRALALRGIQEKASSLSEKASIEKEYDALIGSLNMRKHEADVAALFLVEGVHAFLTKLDEELEVADEQPAKKPKETDGKSK